MSGLLAVIALVFLAAAGVAVRLLWNGLREQAALRRALDVVMLEVLLPKDTSQAPAAADAGEQIGAAAHFLATLSELPTTWIDRLLYGPPLVVLEIAVRPDGLISFFAGTERRFADHLEKQIYAAYPDAEVRESVDYTLFTRGDSIAAGRISLRKKSHLPIATWQELSADPLQGLTGALAKIQGGDAAAIQFVCQPAKPSTRRKGAQAARRTVQGMQGDVSTQRRNLSLPPLGGRTPGPADADERGRQLTPRAQERVELVERKNSQPQFDVSGRIAVSAREADEARRMYEGIANAFAQYSLPDLNGLSVRRVGKSSRFIREFVFRLPRRKTMTLSADELASLYHFPLPTTETPNIRWRGAKAAPAPPDLPPAGLLLGENVYRGVRTPVHFAAEDRRRHLYMIGQTGTGKTTLFLNMAIQDIGAGAGVGVVDPHGDLIEDLLLHIPPERAGDVILFDPRDAARPLGLNILAAADSTQQDLVVNEVVHILQKLAARLNPESVGPMFEHYLRNALLALAEDPSATLLDVPRMFVDADFRARVLSRVSHPTVAQFWEQEFAQSQRGQLSADMLSYVISKLGRFISNRTMRNIIGQAHSSFDMRAVMDERKILLCNLSKGSLGDINSDLLGYLLVSKLQIAALSRADVPENERADFNLYLDEFQNFTTDSIAIILSEARKYHLNLHLTHQFTKQLAEPIRDAVFGNVGTMVSFRVGTDDAAFLAPQFSPVFSEYDLVNLERFRACLRLLVDGTPRRPFSLATLPSPAAGSADVREAVRARSRDTYGRPADEVEAAIIDRFRSPAAPTAAAGGEYLSESLFDVH